MAQNDFQLLLSAAIDIQKSQNKVNEQINKLKTEALKVDIDLDTSVSKKAIKEMSAEYQNAFQLKKNSLDQNISTYLSKNAKLSKDLRAEFTKLQTSIGSIDDASSLNNVSKQLGILKSQAKELGQEGKTVLGKFSSDIGNFLTFFVGAGSVVSAISSIKQMVSNVAELDRQLVELSKVSDLSASGLKKVTDQAYELGATVGKTGTDAISTITDFVRAGYDLQDALDLSKQALMMVNVSENITDASVAAEDLVHILNGLGEDSSYASTIVDAINQVSNTQAVDFDNLVDGATRLSAVAEQAGVSFEQMLGILTAGYSTLGDMEKVASGAITIFTRLQSIQLDGEDGVETIAKLQKEFSGATNGVVNIVDQTTGQLRNAFDILNDLDSIWDSLDKNTQEALAFSAGGTRQKSVFLSILQNWDMVKESVQSATDSVGSAEEENQKYLDSISGKLEAFSSQFEQLSQDTIDSDFIKNVVTLGTELLKITDDVGLFSLALVALAGVLGAKGIITLFPTISTQIAVLANNMGVASASATVFGNVLMAALPMAAILIGITAISKAYDGLNVTVEETSAKVTELKESYAALQSEYDTLSAKQEVTSFEKDRLEYLERRLELDKKILDIETKKQYQNLIGTSMTDVLDKDSLLSKQVGVGNKTDSNSYVNLTRKTDNNLSDLQDINLLLDEQVEKQKNINKDSEQYAWNQEYINSLTDKQTKIYSKLSTYQDDFVTKQGEYLDYANQADEAVSSGLLTGSDLTQAKEMSTYWHGLYDEINNYLTQMGYVESETDSATDSASDAVDNIATSLDGAAKSASSLSDTITSLKTVSDALSSLDSAFAQLTSGEAIDISNFTALQTAFGTLDGFDNFIKVASSATSVTSEVQSAFEKLLGTYIESTGILDTVSEETKDLVISQLEQMGVSNAQSIVNKKLADTAADLAAEENALALEKEYVISTGKTLADSSIDEINAFINQQNASSDTKESLYQLALEKLTLNNTKLDFSSDIEQIISLANAAGTSTTAMSRLARANATIANANTTFEQTFKSGIVNGKVDTEAIEKYVSGLKEAQDIANSVTNGTYDYEFDKLDASDYVVPTYSGGSDTISAVDKKKKESDSSGSSETPAWLTDYNTKKDDLDHNLAMEKITQEEYYDKLEKLNNKVYKNHKKDFLDTYRQNQEEIYDGRKQIDDDLIKSKFDDNENDYNLGTITEEEYYSKLEKLNEKYYKNNTDHAEDYQTNLEKLYQYDQEKLKEAYQKKIDTINKVIDKYSDLRDIINDTAEGQSGDTQVSTYSSGIKSANQAISYIEKEINKLNKKKITTTFTQDDYDSQLETLQSALAEAYSSINDFNNSISESVQTTSEDTMDALEDNYDKMTEYWENEQKAYTDIVNAQKEILQLKKEQSDYEKTIADKTSDISSVESRMAELQKAASTGDREANAELQKLSEELTDKKEDLADTQSDHEYDLANDALDKALDDNDKIVDAKLESLKNEYETQRDNQEKLYNQLIELTSKASSYTIESYSSAIDEIVAKMATNGITLGSDYIDSLKDAQAGSSSTATAVQSILSKANGTGSGTSDLNEYVQSKNYNQLSYANMAELASVFGISGVTAENIKGDTLTKNTILAYLKRYLEGSTFSTGGIASLTSGLGEDGIAFVKNREPILSVEQGVLFKEFIKNLSPLNNLVKLSTPNLSNVVTNNNSSPVVNINLPAGTTIDKSAINDWKQFVPQMTDAVSKELLNVQRQYK